MGKADFRKGKRIFATLSSETKGVVLLSHPSSSAFGRPTPHTVRR
jgi:hypothetical protein